MNSRMTKKDLAVLTPDKNIQFALQGIVSRTTALGIRNIDAEYLIHPKRNPGTLREAHIFLREIALGHYEYALVVLDREGSGQEGLSREELEAQVEQNLTRNGWKDRCTAIVIDPELETWIWTRSSYVAKILGWKEGYDFLESWLSQNAFLQPGQLKPVRPKEAMEAILRETRLPRSSALYKELAQKLSKDSLEGCKDPAFCKLRDTLRKWFPR